jgi:cobalt-zinc-cadmium efflux system outer membrane protein
LREVAPRRLPHVAGRLRALVQLFSALHFSLLPFQIRMPHLSNRGASAMETSREPAPRAACSVPIDTRGAALAWACTRLLVTLLGCSASAGSATYRSLQSTYPRSEPLSTSPAEDTRLLSGPALERASFVRAVLERNPSIEAARQGWRAALARLRQAGTLEDPMLDVSVAPLSIASSEARLGFEATLSQKLPWWGKRSLEASASAAEAEAARNDFESSRLELALAAVMLYEQYFIAAKSLEINASHVELMRAMSDAATAQFSSGHGSAQDALQAEAELAHLEHDAAILETQRDVTRAQMNELLHRSPEAPLPPPPAELPTVPESSSLVSEGAVLDRSDIRAAEQRAQAQRARAERAEHESYPDFTLSTSYSSMWDMVAHRWMLGLGLNLPIQTNARQGAAEEARATQAQFEEEAVRLRDTARTQIFVARKQLAESEHVLHLFETRLLPLARQRIEAARAGFVTSQNPFTAVIDAERGLRALELDYQKARAEHVERRAELDRASGRIAGIDWQEGKP